MNLFSTYPNFKRSWDQSALPREYIGLCFKDLLLSWTLANLSILRPAQIPALFYSFSQWSYGPPPTVLLYFCCYGEKPEYEIPPTHFMPIASGCVTHIPVQKPRNSLLDMMNHAKYYTYCYQDNRIQHKHGEPMGS